VREQFCEARFAAKANRAPLIFFLHGGFWRAAYDLAHAGHICGALARAGANTVNVEYRRVGQPGGGWPGTLEDVRAAYNYVMEHAPEFGLDTQRVLVMGHSAGGHLAVCLTSQEPSVRLCVSLAGVLDLHRAWSLHLSNDAVAEFLGGTPQQAPERYRAASPLELPIPQARQLIIHGVEDDVVPVDISRAYCERKRARKERVGFLALEGASHFDVIDPRSPPCRRVVESVAATLEE
jgi:acetyl esterase/lipase